MSSTVEYIKYLRDVLGVGSVIWPADREQRTEDVNIFVHTRTGHFPQQTAFDLIVVDTSTTGGFFKDGISELWEKMKSAMHLGDRQVLELESSVTDVDSLALRLAELYSAQVLLVLSDTPNRQSEFRTLGPFRLLETFSPQRLLQESGLKKITWQDLQNVMSVLGISVAKN